MAGVVGARPGRSKARPGLGDGRCSRSKAWPKQARCGRSKARSCSFSRRFDLVSEAALSDHEGRERRVRGGGGMAGLGRFVAKSTHSIGHGRGGQVIVCGDYAVGKTSLIRRYCENTFSPNYKLTIGVDFSVKALERDETTVKLQIWDIAGHERFGCMTHAYYKHCIAAVVVYDVTRDATFDSVIKWKRDINSKVVLANGEPVPTLLLANKADSGSVPSPTELDDYCAANGFIGWFATSARENIGITEAMDTLTTHILRVAESNIPRETATGIVSLVGAPPNSGGAVPDSGASSSDGSKKCACSF
ncbi:Rab32 [Thecamonas trahens ATCC 50062]|uniref:Ras-related protein Rab n=1 Tax=Thecamonas trahens ATCC 50062 TaxID=461836 RepID=A0A0L0DU13_THETB|nr:Rab32 [Thecamonas trahens ATCC 50062]KNC55745.1 Rab32 [Thecamonas trahens ATCC 50062]|eukprot:XP_013752898.1 Rab32 [Thecamonas trahens ATCC 50062]